MSERRTLTWEELEAVADQFRTLAADQFLDIYRSDLTRTRDPRPRTYGDEVEYALLKFDDNQKTARLSLRAEDILEILHSKTEDTPPGALWQPEGGAYMIEGLPGLPYNEDLDSLILIEANLKYRRACIKAALDKDEVPLLLAMYPRLGCPNFTVPWSIPTPGQGLTQSRYIPDQVVSGRQRYRDMTENFIKRRGKLVCYSPRTGCCSLQVTLQSRDQREVRMLYDQLTPLTPILLAMTAASPIHRGFLSNHDVRWALIGNVMDDRTAEEKGEIPLRKSKYRIHPTVDKSKVIAIIEKLPKDVPDALGSNKASALPKWHALTGSDTTGHINGKSKKACFEAFLKASPSIITAVSALGIGSEPSEETIYGCVSFLCSLFCKKGITITRPHTLRWTLFKQQGTDKGVDMLPPSFGAWLEHIQRAHCQAAIWEHDLVLNPVVPDPTKLGWTKQDDRLVPELSKIAPAPAAVVELVRCSCGASNPNTMNKCASVRCSCRVSALACTEFCRCEAEADMFQNMNNNTVDPDDIE